MLAIHDGTSEFIPRWFDYCRMKGIPYKLVDCYADDIVHQLSSCSALLWHYSHSDPRDLLVARHILSALEHAGLVLFPDFRTAWHFDDKVGQKYLFEALDIPRVNTCVLVERVDALKWAATTDFPNVFNLRHEAGSSNVKLVDNAAHARRLIKRAFGHGIPVYRPWCNLKERYYKWPSGKSGALELLKGVVRFFIHQGFREFLDVKSAMSTSRTLNPIMTWIHE
ncbi:MAG: hypothetical protein OEQ39_26560 [Gammaproteobacteria bacterium]|nr:hypothetical protein [Gammaproteobacteria bacterium]